MSDDDSWLAGFPDGFDRALASVIDILDEEHRTMNHLSGIAKDEGDRATMYRANTALRSVDRIRSAVLALRSTS